HAAALAALVALVFSVPVLDVQARRKDRARQAVAALRERLPPNPRLVSFGAIHEKFVYHWAVHHWSEPIPILPMPARAEDVPDGLELFAVDVHAAEVPPLPFEYEELARVDMDPKRKRSYHVLVARRVR
ncbi:MAG TPA: hypothetical protein VJP77_02870, partial [Planctomycetota bacterium]|nr:hypothetical protein [Planctomycetota bacterium]